VSANLYLKENTMPAMRAKLQIASVTKHGTMETLKFHGVGRSTAYPEDGSDEDNTFAKFTPCVSLEMSVTNPALLGVFEPGQKFYVDFTAVE
jgi:hypothetical protein